MKKVKKKKLTKDQRVIKNLMSEMDVLKGQKSQAEYQLRKSETTLEQYIHDLNLVKKRDEATKAKLDLITCEIVNTARTLEATPFDQEARHLQRIIGIAEGRLKAVLSLTETWQSPYPYDGISVR